MTEIPSDVATAAEPADTGPGTGRVHQLGHIVLYVSDLKRSLAFYRDALGWPVILQDPRGFAIFRAGHTHHDLVLMEVGKHAKPIPRGRRLGMFHFGVKVGDSDDDLRAVLARLRTMPDITINGLVDEGFAHCIYLTDPDGNDVELYVDIPGQTWDPPEKLLGPRRPLHL
ncbi:VOC family protein [Kitasatospora sp. NPDC059599]|uniref:VOC family protein n=1 Tax=Kitasatospora sp. NPDC059599 TaxID=3346880 RepID=UPI003685AF56